ncbi:calcium-activated potassium channel subunit beta-3 [Colossoma macropomum]|uniref:calcium-activated potassium channel subunit beta-3 n=1 Tax=Colossoma macropomum TaxID=42526 RepID=UPI0018647EF9|nr:calcium-activated potassium channel subunit beta-3 [Colossoma macropomum]
MLLSPSPRGSFSVPVHINLRNARRRRTRELLQYPSGAQESQWRRCRAGEKAKAQAPVSSVGEERALLLGFAMVAFSILMYFVVGIVVVKPCLNSDWGEAISCSVIQAELLNDSDDWRCLNSSPCLQVFVNITASGRRALLHYDEVSVNLSPECFYAPKSQQNNSELMKEAQRIQQYLLNRSGEAISCHPGMGRHSEEVILKRRYTLRLALQCLVWPSLMLFGGGLLVGLVMLTQCLAHICAEILAREGGEGSQTLLTQGKLYQLLRCRPRSPSMEQDPNR